jgi:hypothetical protein
VDVMTEISECLAAGPQVSVRREQCPLAQPEPQPLDVVRTERQAVREPRAQPQLESRPASLDAVARRVSDQEVAEPCRVWPQQVQQTECQEQLPDAAAEQHRAEQRRERQPALRQFQRQARRPRVSER